MTTPMHSAQALVEKIQSLPANRIIEVEDFIDFLKRRTSSQRTTIASNKSLDFPVMSIGQWPSDLNLSREDMYGDDGR